MKPVNNYSRREFIKLLGLTLGGLALSRSSLDRVFAESGFSINPQLIQPEFPLNKTLGRICSGDPGAHFPIKSEPYWDAPEVGTAWRDDVFEWKKEVIAKQLDPIRINQRWVETEAGYIYAQYVQKIKHIPQEPIAELPQTPSGERGMWVEIVTPYTGMTFAKPPAQTWVRETINPRIYYSQIFWAFDIRTNPENGKTEYCLKQLYGALPDEYWIDATVCRQITPEEISPIHPDAEDKHIIVNLLYQTLSCYEGDEEVFFTKVTTGWKDKEGEWQTPLGTHTIWRKILSTHMSGTIVGGYDLSGIGWTTLFDNHGAAIHATYWHNEFGIPGSHGCVNTKPEDAKWIWRWTEPKVDYYPGDLVIQGQNKSTKVEVIYD
ncbi:MAG: L,D-transpeptidase [Brevefilum sp.]|nr:L,D-transpeptidase [Brevefilum sp.]MDT8381212.1 L,D-transpeptidase [Brevefilum sp.]MDW7754401.1 L,D-transpeptidase [Brevefilum sp.]